METDDDDFPTQCNMNKINEMNIFTKDIILLQYLFYF